MRHHSSTPRTQGELTHSLAHSFTQCASHVTVQHDTNKAHKPRMCACAATVISAVREDRSLSLSFLVGPVVFFWSITFLLHHHDTLRLRWWVVRLVAFLVFFSSFSVTIFHSSDLCKFGGYHVGWHSITDRTNGVLGVLQMQVLFIRTVHVQILVLRPIS